MVPRPRGGRAAREPIANRRPEGMREQAHLPRGFLPGERSVRRGVFWLAHHAEVSAPVPLPCRLVVSLNGRLALAEAHRVDARGGYAGIHQVLLDGVGATLAESEIVLLAAALVAVPFDHDDPPLRVLFGGHSIRLDRGFMIVENKGEVVVEVEGVKICKINGDLMGEGE